MTRRFRKPVHNSQHGGILSSLISLLFLIVFCFVLYAARRPLLRLAGESWVVEDPLQQSDALLLLGDDNFFADRATRASELYRQKLAPVVVASGRRLRPTAGISELMEHDLIERGVPKDRIIRFPQDADNTLEEAQALRTLVIEKNWRSVIVVTSNYHTRRARYIFQRLFPESVTVRVASARDGGFDPEHWWESRKSLKEFIQELVAMVVATWELRRDSVHTAQSLLGYLSPAGVQGLVLPEQQSQLPVIVVYSTPVVYYLHSSESRPCPVLRSDFEPQIRRRGVVPCGKTKNANLKQSQRGLALLART